MCGINGFIDFRKLYTKEQRTDLVHRMNEKIRYRGPNQEGSYSNGQLTMGMRRLSVIDVENGSQPIFNEQKNLAVVYNGEIYNFKHLRKCLADKGHFFQTKTDTEVIIHGYEEYGNEIFKMLDGMFAIALYNSDTGKLIIARDKMGEKPLFYYKNTDVFLFGSELKSLVSTGFVHNEINKVALNQYFQLTYIPSPLTIYQNVYKLLPGHFLEVFSDGTFVKNCYWNLKDVIGPDYHVSLEESKLQLKEKLAQAVKERMVSDVPLGAFLSGGIDSSIIVGLMSKYSNQPVETFTIGFHEKEYDERERARKVADYFHTNHHECILDYKETMNMVDDILNEMDEPFADSSVLPTYLVSKFASQYVKVVLTGDAGDELFLGYSKYLMKYYTLAYKRIPGFVRKKMLEPLFHLLPDNHSLTRKINKVLSVIDKQPCDQWITLMSNAFKTEELYKLLNPQFFETSSLDMLKNFYEECPGDDFKKVQYLDLKVVLEGDMLVKADRMSMLHSLETRTPMLANDIVSFALKLPTTYKISKNRLKIILKETFHDILPSGFTKLPKSGFAVPLDYWFRNELKEELNTVFSKDVVESQGIFNYSYISEILEEHFTQKKNRKSEIWTLYVFQKWFSRNMPAAD